VNALSKALGASLAAIMLSGCAGTVARFEEAYKVASGLTITQNQFDLAHNGYDAGFLVPFNAYVHLGICHPGVQFTLANPCADRAVVIKLRAKDRVVADEFATVQAMIKAGNNTGIEAEWAFLQSAITSAEQLASDNGVKP
jgi:hypothetical protein